MDGAPARIDPSEIGVERSRREGIDSTNELEPLTARISVGRGGGGELEDPETGKVS